MLLKKHLNIDLALLLAIVPVLAAGLITMSSFGTENNYYFARQIVWIAIGLIIFFAFSFVDWRFLRRGGLLLLIYFLSVVILIPLIIIGQKVKGAASWYNFDFFSIQPGDPAKLALILLLAKYFSRRHVEIAHFKHIIVSAVYALVLFTLVFFQPDFGSALVIFIIWFGMILVSGISKKHLLVVFIIAGIAFSVSWFFVLKPYQKERVLTFLHPLSDIKGAGYNAVQSTIAVGSGQVFGKGVGFGTQSRLEFLPEHQTDFIFSAFAEEWGLMGVIFLLSFYGLIVWRILRNAMKGESNFECLYGTGLAILIMAHFIIHIGMNVGLLPITGIGLPFMSYGGSNLLTTFGGLGILMGMRRYSREIHKDDMRNEFVGF